MKAVVEDKELSVTIKTAENKFEGFRKVISFSYQEDQSGIAATREIVTARHAVAVVTFDPVLNKLVMIRQFRLGAQLGTGKGFAAEFPAGLIDDGEQAEQTAHRELLEETGLTASTVRPLCQFLTTPGLTDEVIHLYYAEVDASELLDEAGHAGESEQTFPFLLSIDEALHALDNNTIYNGIVMVGLMWFVRNKDQLVRNSR